MRTILAAALSLALLLAGCSSSSDNDDTPAPTTTPPATTAPGTTSPGTTTSPPTSAPPTSAPPTSEPPSENKAPEVKLSASVATGPAPLNVSFTVTAADPEGEALTGTLSFGDGSPDEKISSFPATIKHTYATAGNKTAVVTVSDGDLSTKAEAKVLVSAAGGGGPTVFTGKTTLPGNPTTSGTLGANGCFGFNSGQNEQDCAFFELAADLAGHSYSIATTGADTDAEFWTACDPVAGTYISGGEASEEVLKGTVPAEAGCLILWEFGVGVGEYIVTVQ